MNVVIIDGDVSYPPNSGKRLRTLNLMRPLAARHHLTYIARGEGDREADRRAIAYFASQNIAARIIDAPLPRKKGLSFFARLGANLASSLPYSVSSHQSEAMQRAVRQFASTHRVDLWQVEWSGYLYTLPPSPAPVVLQAHNVDSLIWQRYHDSAAGFLRRWYIRQQWHKFARFEAQAFRSATRVVAVSAEDAALARDLYKVDNLDIVDNGVEADHFAAVHPEPGSRTILYLGALDWRPNLDALILLLDSIFPTVRARFPEAKLCVVGRSPPDWLVKRVQDTPGAELHANVPDVRPFLAKSAVMAVPLRIGGGSRLKILESLACGLPVVSTKVGAEGLCLRPGQDFILADTNDEMATALVRCLTEGETFRAQAEEARGYVRERYDWPVLSERLERVWEKAVAQRRGG